MTWNHYGKVIEFTPKVILKFHCRFYTIAEFKPYDFLPVRYALLENQLGYEDDWEKVGEFKPTKADAVEQIPGLLMNSTIASEDDMRKFRESRGSTYDHQLGVPQGAYAEDAGIYGWDLD